MVMTSSGDSSGPARPRGFVQRLLGRRLFVPPRTALILQPCCMARVMQTTPLLAALSEAFPSTRFDWAVSDWARQAVSTNPRLTRVILTGSGDVEQNSREANQALLKTIRAEGYDTCFIPNHITELEQLAKQAGIGQRITPNSRGVAQPTGDQPVARTYLALAEAVGVSLAIIEAAGMEYEPPDPDRVTMTHRLVEELDWLGDKPLVIIHPGGGDNPQSMRLDKRWPAERFARLANHLIKAHNACVVLAGTEEERTIAKQVAGMMSFPAANWAGRMGLGELGALCELATLYVGNDNGSTHVAAAAGCPTLVIYGPTNPAIHRPYVAGDQIVTLWHAFDGDFSWQDGVTVDEAVRAAERLLAA